MDEPEVRDWLIKDALAFMDQYRDVFSALAQSPLPEHTSPPVHVKVILHGG